MHLIDLGEREIIRRLIAPLVSGLGDDCAAIALGDDYLVATTDPVPVPAAQVVAGDPDPYWAGWLLVTINASDIAAAGAEPIGFMAALESQPDTTQADFARLLNGVADSCAFHGFPYIGGNIKEAQRFAATGVALGICKGRRPLGRSGAKADQVIALVGARPRFWADALTAKAGAVMSKDSPLFKPRAATEIMGKLARRGLLSAAIDNSDGLLPSAEQLAERSGVCVEIDTLALRRIGSTVQGVDPARLSLGWGDWNVLCALDAGDVDECQRLASICGLAVEPIGKCAPGGGVFLRNGTSTIQAPRLESERFSRDSWFLEGIDGYIGRLLNLELPG